MMNGFNKIVFKKSFMFRSAFSIGAYHRSSPVSFLVRLAFLTNKVGAYVSGTAKMMTNRQTLAKMVVTQNTHLQDYPSLVSFATQSPSEKHRDRGETYSTRYRDVSSYDRSERGPCERG